MSMKRAVEPASDILTIAVGGPFDPDGSSLRQLLQCELDYERARAAWWRWLWIFAAATCAQWLVWPQVSSLLPVIVRSVALPLWMLVCARVGVAAVTSWYRARRWDEVLANHPAADVRVLSR